MKRLLLETSFSKIYMIVMIIVTLSILGGYFSYAMFTVTKEKSNAISIVTGNLIYDLKVDGIDQEILVVPAGTTKVFTVTLSNPNNRKARYNFYYVGSISNDVKAGYIVDCETNNLPTSVGVNLEASGSAGSSNIYKIMVENNSENEISIELGVNVGLDYNDLKLPSNGHIFEEYVNVPNAPELDSNMIVVSYNGSNWVKADRSNTDNSWYNYDMGIWANAVTVSESTRDNYLNASNGTVINMDDIETMWVWIPRYSYSIGSEDGTNYYGKQGEYLDTTPTQELPGEIDVKFVPAGEKDRCSAKYVVGEKITSWYTPDAFTFGDEELSGIWVGKFETSNTTQSSTNSTSPDPIIKPNVSSWRSINVSNIYNVGLKVSAAGNRYGFNTSMNSHAMKNNEWAVVSYLSQSRYGKLGNENFSGANKEIYQNKSNSYITGCSYGSPSNGNTDYGCQYTYDSNINGTGASTTGNIYGVYDMSGGAWEYVMANYNNMAGDSGFDDPLMLDSKYYNLYTSNDVGKSCNGEKCIGHGLSETAGWYNDYHSMVSETYPWLVHGGYYGDNTDAGVFQFYSTAALGGVGNFGSFRLIMSPSP